MNNQDNGNTQLNSERENFNHRIKSKKFLGNAPRVTLNSKRRFRAI